MSLKTFKSYTKSTRGTVLVDKNELWKGKPFKSLVTSKNASIGGKLKGNINSDQIVIQKTADIEGVLNQKTLSIEEGAVLKIKTETYK